MAIRTLDPRMIDPSRPLSISNSTVLTTGSLSARSLQDRFADIVNVLDFGAKGDGVIDDTNAIQLAFNRGVALNRPFTLYLPAGNYLVSNQILLSSAAYPYKILGDGRRKTTILVTAFGADKAVFRGKDTFTSDYDPLYIEVEGLSFTSSITSGGSPVSDRAHPIALYFPGVSRLMLSNISSSGYGNSIIFAGPAYNSDWNNLELFTTGFQPLYKTISSNARVSITSGSSTLSANSDIFETKDIGKTIYVQQYTSSQTGPPTNSTLVATITSVTSSTQAAIDKPCFATSSSRRISFDSIRGSINQSASTLTFEASCLSSSDVGRFVIIDGAGSETGSALTAKITSVTSISSCELDKTSNNTLSGAYVWFAPAIYVGERATEIAGNSGSKINDLTLTDVHIEQNRGPAVYLGQGTQVHFTRYKNHGRPFGDTNDFGMSRQWLIASGTSKVTINQAQFEFGCFGTDSGGIIAAGDPVSLTLGQTTMGAATHGAYLFDYRTSDENSFFVVGDILASKSFSKDKGLIKTTGTASTKRINGRGYIASNSLSEERSYSQLPTLAGSFGSVIPFSIDTNNYAFIPTTKNFGFVSIGSDLSSTNALLWYNTNTGTLGLQSTYTSLSVDLTTGALNGTTGNNNKVTISAGPSAIYIENRIGSTRNFAVTFLG